MVGSSVVWIVPPIAGLIEPMPVPEVFIDAIGGIELVAGGWVRLYGCSEQMPLEAGSERPQRIVQVKIVRPLVTIPEAILGMARCLCSERTPGIVPGGPFPRLVS